MNYTAKRFATIFIAAAVCVFASCHMAVADAPENDSLAPQREQEKSTLAPGDLTPDAEQTSPTASASEKAEEAPSAKLVESIEVIGHRIINDQTILSKLRTRVGEPLKRDIISDDIKRLYGTGFFRDIQMDYTETASGGYQVVVKVDEKPIIKQVIVEGSTKFSESDLKKELGLVDGQVLSDFELKEGVDAIRKKYQAKGFPFVEVKHEVNVDQAAKEATVYVRVNEGAAYRIRSIKLEGVKAFKERKVRKLMRTKKARWFRKGAFQEEKFSEDLERVQAFYQEHGYLDVTVEPQFTYDHEQKRIDIRLTIEEGRHYETGKVDITGNVLFPESEIWQELAMLPGLTYSVVDLSEDTDAIRKYYYERGYLNAEVEPDVEMDTLTGKMNVTYRITEGDLFFIDEIKIRGNTKTKDLVIRRELLFFPGERFDGKKMERSNQRLEDLGYFEEVRITTEDGSAPNRRNVVVYIQEKRTGELSFGGGISSVEQFVAFAEISQRNFDFKNFPTFTGAGQHLSVRGRLGSVRQDIEVEFVEPYIFNKPYSLSISLFDRTRQRNNVDFDESRLGFSVDVGKRFTETVSSAIGYTLENVELDDIDSDASMDVRASGTENLLSRMRWSITRDSRDSIRKPTRGSVLSFWTELVGSILGGDQDLFKYQVGFTKFFSFGRHRLEWGNRFGVISPFGESDQVPVFERFYAGGLGSVRGFDARRVGPIEGGDAVGGSTIILTSLEYSFPIIENFRAGFFIDVGHVNEASFDMDFGDLAMSVGPGLQINTPIGPVALYYGIPIFNADEEDENGKFEFSLSRGF